MEAMKVKMIPEEKIKTLCDRKEAEKFIRNHCQHRDLKFCEYYSNKLSEHQMSLAEAMRRSGINRNYGYNIVSGARKNPSRDKILALCIGAGMSVSEIQEATDIAKVGRLFFRSERDVRIAVAVNNGIIEVVQINMILSEYDLPLIEV